MAVLKTRGLATLLILLIIGVNTSLASLPIPPSRYGVRPLRLFSNHTFSSNVPSTATLSDIASQTWTFSSTSVGLSSSELLSHTRSTSHDTSSFLSSSSSSGGAATSSQVSVPTSDSASTDAGTVILSAPTINTISAPNSVSTISSLVITDTTSTIDPDSISTTGSTSADTISVTTSTQSRSTNSIISTSDSTSTEPTSTTLTTDSTSSNSATTDTASSADLPPFTTPTGTLTSGPAETSEAVAIAPILLYLWSKKSLLQDEEHKQQYIDNVKRSQKDSKALFDRFKEKPPAKPECNKKSMKKRSLISGILDAFKEVADLVSCAVNVLDNLADAVDKIRPPIPEIDILTDTLKDLGNEIKKRGDEKPTSASSYASSSTVASSSCTAAITKTWESILCTVTATSSINGRRQDQGCTTEVYSTVTGCSVVASTTTSITTIAPESTPISLCEFGSCGSGQNCPQKKREFQKRVPPRLSDPAFNTWSGPENYGGSRQQFIAGESWRVYENPVQESYRGVKLETGTTSNLISFLGETSSLAVAGLYGCTTVIAVSRRGAWASHSWEAPSFTPYSNDLSPPTDLEQHEIFQREVLEALHKGTSVNHLYGLSELRVTANNNMFPTTHLLEDDADPRIFIFMPYERGELGTINWNNEFPVGLPEAWGQDDGLPSKNQQIENEIKAIFKIPNGLDVPYEKVLYAPREGLKGEDLGDKDFDSNREKVLVQYQPAKSCQDKASWRVWFEGHALQDSHQSSWTPSANQIVDYQGALKDRDDSAGNPIDCPLPSSTVIPSVSSTSQGTSLSIIASPASPTGQSTLSSLVTLASSTAQSSSSSTATLLSSSTGQNTVSSIVTLASSTVQGSSSSTPIQSVPSTNQVASSSTMRSPTSSTVQSTLSSIETLASTIVQSSSLSIATLLSSSTDESTSLPSQYTSSFLSMLSSTSVQGSSTSLSSTETPTETPTTTSELTTESPTDVTTTTSSEPTPTPTTIITPLQAFDIVCNKESDFPGHADVSRNWQGKFAHVFGSLWMPEGGLMSNSSPAIDGKFKDNHGISYEYSVSWVAMCVTTEEQQSFQFPLDEQGELNAETILKDDYKLCNNGGVGGSRQVGCLEYTFIGAK
ncbi:hypothetical protein F4678DRAFT_465186 [Xylaria arbuscula]|nr:hypothetical protein F4678DRAFT_465186 [Xylaria arbuscula]